jgi:predicted metalloendopeptidase
LIPPDVQTYFNTNPDIYVYTEKMMQELNTFLKDPNRKETLANYLFVKLVARMVPLLDSRFVIASHKLIARMEGRQEQPDRKKDCYDTIIRTFPLVIDHLYAKRYLTDRTFNIMEAMISNTRISLSEIIRGERWMDPTTKNYALTKLQRTGKIIGAVDDAKDPTKLDNRYNGITITPTTDSYLQMAVKGSTFLAQEAIRWLIDPKKVTFSEQMRASGRGVNA